MWHWHKDKYADQQNRTESPGINPDTYGQLFFQEGCQAHSVRKDYSFLTNDAGPTGYTHGK